MKATPEFAGQEASATQRSGAGEPHAEASTSLSPKGGVPRRPIGADQTATATHGRPVRSDPTLDGQSELDHRIAVAVEGHLASGQSRADAHSESAAGEPHPPPETTDRVLSSVALSPAEPIDPAEAERVERVVAKIRTLHRRASFCTAQRVALGNRLAAFVRVEFLGFSTFDDAAARAKAIAASHKMIKAARAGDALELPEEEATALRGLVLNSDLAMAPFEEIENSCLKRMVKLCRTLPGHAFVTATRGFGEVSFARIIGETNCLHWYAKPGKVWKRLGLAVINGERQRRHTNVELALLHGFNAKRRSVSWVAFESLLKAQGSGETAGPYRQLYDQAKERYLAREGWTKMHSHRAAARYAEKRLLLNLWRAWRHEIRGQDNPATHMSSAPDHFESGQPTIGTQSRDAARNPLPLGQPANVNQGSTAEGKAIRGHEQAATLAQSAPDHLAAGQDGSVTLRGRACGDPIESGQDASAAQRRCAALDPLGDGHMMRDAQDAAAIAEPLSRAAK